jgi:hypothetical protein
MEYKKVVLLSIVIFITVNSFAQFKLDTSVILSPGSIIKITFEHSDRIKSAYYKLESAKYNFKLFESDYTQFNPVIVNSGIRSNSEHQNYSNVSAGMRKEFFDGTSIEASMGNDMGWGPNTNYQNINYIETEISFPLFTSARKLDRLIKRTFEENELYTKNLDYVDAVKENIHDAVEQYYDLVPRIKIYNMLNCKKENPIIRQMTNDRAKSPRISPHEPNLRRMHSFPPTSCPPCWCIALSLLASGFFLRTKPLLRVFVTRI